jgi:starch synthase
VSHTALRVLQVSAELYPLLKTGGLADVTGALPAALAGAGAELRLLLPGFAPILAGLAEAGLAVQLQAPWGERALLRQGRLPALGGTPAWVLDLPSRYGAGHPYTNEHGAPHADSHLRFAWLGWAAAQIALGRAGPGAGGWRPQILHAHDWHAALAHAYLASVPGRGGVKSVYTVHNLAYQGLFDGSVLGGLGLPVAMFNSHELEFHGRLSFMKAGLVFADAITTVSPSYAREIQTPEQGCGLDGLLRARAPVLHGILNGVDETVWDPATDTAIAARFDADHLDGKARCRLALQQELGLDALAGAPLFAMVSRLTGQKGVDLLVQALPALLAGGGQLAVLGSGDGALERALQAAAAAHPRRMALRVGYDEALAHRLFAGSDVTLVPSLFEPCGLTQMYGLRYGSLPLVRRVGGLADTVVDSTLEDLADGRANGFVFDAFSADALARALRRAEVLFARPAEWRAVQQRGMRQHCGWDRAAARYAAIYAGLLADAA